MKTLQQALTSFALILSFSAQAYPPSDTPLPLFKGLQDLFNTMSFISDSPDEQRSIGLIKEPDLVEKLISPWQKEAVEKAQKDYKASFKDAVIEMVKSTLYDVKGDLKELYYASGKKVTPAEVTSTLELLKKGTFLNKFHPNARAITIRDTDALFIPSDYFITNNLTGPANTASDQKSSSTAIPRNTPVFVIAQLEEFEGLDKSDSSWLVIWRPECGVKFVKSKSVGWLTQEDIAKYESVVKTESQLRITSTSRVKFAESPNETFMRGTPVARVDERSEKYLLAMNEGGSEQRSLEAPDSSTSMQLELYKANFMEIYPYGIEQSELNLHAPEVPIQQKQLTVIEYLNQLHNATFEYPRYAKPPQNRKFAWGEGVVGPDNQRGQDVSTFIREIFLPFGLSLPRFTADQVKVGTGIRLIHTCSSESQNYFEDMIKYCKLGNFASFGQGSNMACLGIITVEDLYKLDADAGKYALDQNTGGMSPEDHVPLVIASPVGFRDTSSNKWSITAETGIYFLTKSGPFSSWTNNARVQVTKSAPMVFYSFISEE